MRGGEIMRTSLEIIRDMKKIETSITKLESLADTAKKEWQITQNQIPDIRRMNVPVNICHAVYSLIENYYWDEINKLRIQMKNLVIELQQLDVE